MNAFYKPAFRKFVKKQTKPFQLAIEDEVEKVIHHPEMGEDKKGDLAGLKVYKFTFRKQKYLVAYTDDRAEIIFYMIGTHENFYRDLKNYLKE